MSFVIPRRPQNKDELHALIKALWNVDLPRNAVCPDHVSPLDAVAYAFFADAGNFSVWYCARGGGKSLALAALGLTKAFVDEVGVTVLGGSMVQSLNVRQHMRDMMGYEHAPSYAVEKDIATLIETKSGAKIEPLPASQKTVRGKHPVLQIIDEADELEYDVYQASLGQAMEKRNIRGDRIIESVVVSSTWQNPDGSFTKIMEDARERGHPIFSWCLLELLEENGGWMSRRFMEAKKATVSAKMWETEYLLGEPSSSDRAIDLDKVEDYFVAYPDAVHQTHKPDDDAWVWEAPETSGAYVVGADWGKAVDYTVIGVVRVDVNPRRLVKLRIAKRRPWPEMIGWFRDDIRAYHALDGKHDKTGLGGALHDWIDTEDTSGFVFVGRQRTELLLDYITAFEHGHYLLPRRGNDDHEVLERLRRAHRGITIADVYAPGKWDSHLPDEIAMMALAHRAATSAGVPVEVPYLTRDSSPRKVDAPFHATPEQARTEGLVTKVEEEPAMALLWTGTEGGSWI